MVFEKMLTIIGVALCVLIILAGCQKSDEPSAATTTDQKKADALLKSQTKTTASSEISSQNKNIAADKTIPLSKDEQKVFDDIGGGVASPNAFNNDKQAISYLKVLLKSDPDNIKWYQDNYSSGAERKKVYAQDIATALSAINMKTDREGLNLAIEVMNSKKEYPEAVSEAAKEVKFAHDPSVIPVLREALNNPNPSVRIEAAGSLLILGDGDTALPALNELAKIEGYPGALYYLFNGPGQIIDNRGYEIVAKALDYQRAEVRISAVKLLLESRKISRTKAEEIALNVLENLKDKTLKNYGLTLRPGAVYDLIALPGANINVNSAKEREYSDARACENAVEVLGELKSKRAVSLLKQIHQKNTHVDCVCFENLERGDGIARGGGMAENALQRIFKSEGEK